MRVKVRFDTLREVNQFVGICTSIPEAIYLTDNKGVCVSAKSLIGVIYSMEFDEVWCECDVDIFHRIDHFIVY